MHGFYINHNIKKLKRALMQTPVVIQKDCKIRGNFNWAALLRIFFLKKIGKKFYRDT